MNLLLNNNVFIWLGLELHEQFLLARIWGHLNYSFSHQLNLEFHPGVYVCEGSSHYCDEAAINLNMLTLQRKTVSNLRSIIGSIELTQVFYQCDSQSRVSVHDNTAIYHGDETKYWLPVTDAEEWDSSKTDFTDLLDQQPGSLTKGRNPSQIHSRTGMKSQTSLTLFIFMHYFIYFNWEQINHVFNLWLTLIRNQHCS